MVTGLQQGRPPLYQVGEEWPRWCADRHSIHMFSTAAIACCPADLPPRRCPAPGPGVPRADPAPPRLPGLLQRPAPGLVLALAARPERDVRVLRGHGFSGHGRQGCWRCLAVRRLARHASWTLVHLMRHSPEHPHLFSTGTPGAGAGPFARRLRAAGRGGARRPSPGATSRAARALPRHAVHAVPARAGACGRAPPRHSSLRWKARSRSWLRPVRRASAPRRVPPAGGGGHPHLCRPPCSLPGCPGHGPGHCLRARGGLPLPPRWPAPWRCWRRSSAAARATPRTSAPARASSSQALAGWRPWHGTPGASPHALSWRTASRAAWPAAWPWRRTWPDPGVGLPGLLEGASAAWRAGGGKHARAAVQGAGDVGRRCHRPAPVAESGA